MNEEMDVRCVDCGKTPEEISEYQPESTGEDTPPKLYVMQNEGTYNASNGHFRCTEDYIKAGMPLGVTP